MDSWAPRCPCLTRAPARYTSSFATIRRSSIRPRSPFKRSRRLPRRRIAPRRANPRSPRTPLRPVRHPRARPPNPRAYRRTLPAIRDAQGLAAGAPERPARHHTNLGGNSNHRFELLTERERLSPVRTGRKLRPRLDDHHHLVHPLRPRDFDFIMRGKTRPIQNQLLDLGRKYIHAADDQHVVGASRDLGEAAHGGHVSRQQAGQIARAVTHDGHGFLGERGEYELPRLARADRLPALRVHDLGEEMILPDGRALLG